MRYFYTRYRQKPRVKTRRPYHPTAAAEIVLALILASASDAQLGPIIDPNTVLGFEAPSAWTTKGGVASATTTRTQGSAAFAITKPAILTTFTSQPVASTLTALKGVGDAGSSFEIDVFLPVADGAPVNHGSLQLNVTSPSRQLNNVLVGKVGFDPLREGIFSTLKFSIPDSVRSALGGAQFTDLTFAFTLDASSNTSGTYIFDNLRVHTVTQAVTGGNGASRPAGYGGSVDLVAVGNTPATQTFAAAPVQVPDSFHLKTGSSTATTVKLELGYEGVPSFNCTYNPSSTDPSGYVLTSCTGGMQAGDLVGASWARLTIVNATNVTMSLPAQLAKNPVGQMTGAGIIPPMPTYWGPSDGCVPALASGTIATTSPSCQAQIAEISRISTDYFNKVNNSVNKSQDWVVTPTPEFARRHGTGIPLANPILPPATITTGTCYNQHYDKEPHMNPGGPFDAYWRLNENLNTNTTQDNHYTTHLDTSFSGHVVVLSNDIDIMSLKAAIDSDSGQITTNGFTGQQSHGSVYLYLFGHQIGGGSNDLSFNYKLQDTQDYDGPTVHIWIFSVTAGATATVGVDAGGGLTATGFNVTLTPHASMGAHVKGGVDVGFASGQVDARVDLLAVSIPLTAQATWYFDPRPSSCSTTVSASINGKLNVSAGSGEIDLDVTFGWCPFCEDASWEVYSWPPPYSSSVDLFSDQLASTSFPLPSSVCTVPLQVTIATPSANTTVSSGLDIPLTGRAFSPNNMTDAPCSDLVWQVSPMLPGDVLTPSTGIDPNCRVSARFATPAPGTTTSRTIKLSSVYPIPNHFQTIIETGQTSEDITVSPLPPGSYIGQTNPQAVKIDTDPNCGFNCVLGALAVPPLNGQTVMVDVPSSVPNPYDPYPFQLSGTVVPPNANTTTATTWTASKGGSVPVTIGTGLSAILTMSPSDTYQVTMTTVDSSGKPVGAPATFTIMRKSIPR